MCEREDRAMAAAKRALEDSNKILPDLRRKTQGCEAPTREQAEALVRRQRSGEPAAQKDEPRGFFAKVASKFKR